MRNSDNFSIHRNNIVKKRLTIAYFEVKLKSLKYISENSKDYKENVFILKENKTIQSRDNTIYT